MLESSPLRPLFRFRIHLHDRSFTFDQSAFEAGKPTSAYVASESILLFLLWSEGLEIGLEESQCPETFQGSNVAL